MRPLTSSAVTTTFLTDRPFLLLNASAFSTRYVGSLLAEGAIRSKGGISLPNEIWFKIFEIVKLPEKTSKYHLARVLTAIPRGEKTTLKCEVELSAITFPLADLDNAYEMRVIESYLAAPGQQHDPDILAKINARSPRPSPTSKFFSISVTDSDNHFLRHCLFHEITVPDVISYLQDNVCGICEEENGHTICPGCTGGKADGFGAFMGCGVDLACPLCLGLSFMERDKKLLETYYWDPMPEEERVARSRRFKRRLNELGY